jgi:hypothetical protein
MTMHYIKVFWKHRHRDEPVELYSELDDGRWEVRKVEVSRDGFLGYASGSGSRGETLLGLVPVPAVAEIAANPEFEPTEITKDEFEEIWLRATRGSQGGS